MQYGQYDFFKPRAEKNTTSLPVSCLLHDPELSTSFFYKGIPGFEASVFGVSVFMPRNNWGSIPCADT